MPPVAVAVCGDVVAVSDCADMAAAWVVMIVLLSEAAVNPASVTTGVVVR